VCIKVLRRFLLASALWALTASSVFALPAPFSDYGREEFSELRTVVDRAQADLRVASELNHGNKQSDRYHKAQDHLSKLDKGLSHGKFNKGALNDAIDGLKAILDHNTIQAHARDALMRDLTDLKVARARR
jgi:hypothetical protein